MIEAGDEVFLLAATKHIRHVLRELRRMQEPVKRIMIAGGGNIGARVAAALEKDYRVKVNVVSIATTTELASVDYNLWPAFAPLWVLFRSSPDIS